MIRSGRCRFAERVAAVAAPGPVFWLFDEATVDGVAVDVFQFLDALLGSANVEVVVTGLPEASVGCLEFLGDGLLQRLYGPRESRAFWFADEQVDVLGHDHVADHVEPITATGLFERALEGFFGERCVKEGLPTITAKGNEVQSTGLLQTD